MWCKNPWNTRCPWQLISVLEILMAPTAGQRCWKAISMIFPITGRPVFPLEPVTKELPGDIPPGFCSRDRNRRLSWGWESMKVPSICSSGNPMQISMMWFWFILPGFVSAPYVRFRDLSVLFWERRNCWFIMENPVPIIFIRKFIWIFFPGVITLTGESGKSGWCRSGLSGEIMTCGCRDRLCWIRAPDFCIR